MLLLLDPTGTAINDLISGLDYAYPNTTKVGGIAGPHSASHGSLFLDDRVVFWRRDARMSAVSRARARAWADGAGQ
jgi:small ligand-binding sensory domain FIST